MRVPESLSASTSRGPQHAVLPEVSLCVILAGGIKSPQLASVSGKSILDVFVSPKRTVLGAWVDRIQAAWGPPKTPEIVVVHGGPGAKPCPDADMGVQVRQDNTEFRGPAGAVRDAAQDQDPASFVLVIEGASFLRCSLERLLNNSVDSAAAVVGINTNGSPAGLYLLRRDILDLVPPIGFMDLKEQLLGQARDAGYRIVVRSMGEDVLQRLRTRQDLLAATNGCAHGESGNRALTNGSRNGTNGAENGVDTHENGVSGSEHSPQMIARRGLGGSCVCDGSNVAIDSLLIDSIAMPGSSVGSQAVVVRSILFEGARVEPGEIVLDQMISAQGRVDDAESKHNGVIQS